MALVVDERICVLILSADFNFMNFEFQWFQCYECKLTKKNVKMICQKNLIMFVDVDLTCSQNEENCFFLVFIALINVKIL